MTKNISYSSILKMRLVNNGLVNRFDSIENCVESLIGIQCQYQNYSIVSIYNRLDSKVKINKIYKSNQIIKSWGQRATLHIFSKSDYNIISDINRDTNNWFYKYCDSLGVDYNDYLDSISNYLKNESNIISKQKIQDIIPQYKVKEIMSWSGLLITATYHKILYGILNENDQKIYKANDIELHKNDLKSIFYRYFRYYGPATKNDFYHWIGFKNDFLEKKLEDYLKKINNFFFNKNEYYYLDIPDTDIIKFPIILGKFDPLLVSYKDKKWILNDFKSNVVWKAAGHIEGVIIFEKGLKATWHYQIKSNKVLFYVEQLYYLTKKDKQKINLYFKRLSKKIFDKDYEIVIRSEV